MNEKDNGIFLTLCNPHSLIVPTRGSNPGLPHCRQILYHLSHKGSSRMLEWVAPSPAILLTQESNRGLLCWRWILYQLSYQEAHIKAHKKEGNPVIFNNIDVSRGHFATWSKSVRKRQIVYDFTYMWNIQHPVQKQRLNNGYQELEYGGNEILVKEYILQTCCSVAKLCLTFCDPMDCSK